MTIDSVVDATLKVSAMVIGVKTMDRVSRVGEKRRRKAAKKGKKIPPVRFKTSEGVKKLKRKKGWKVEILLGLKLAKMKRTGVNTYNIVLTKRGLSALRSKRKVARRKRRRKK